MNDLEIFDVEQISIDGKSLEEKLDKKDTGSYYTPFWLAYDTVSQCMEGLIRKGSVRAIDIACGDGVFLCAYIKYQKKSYPKSNLEDLLLNTFGIDVDRTAVEACKKNLVRCYRDLGGKNVDKAKRIINQNVIAEDTLRLNQSKKASQLLQRLENFIVIGNPPWRLVRNRRDFKSEIGSWSFKSLSTEDLLDARGDWRIDSNCPPKMGEKDLYLSFLNVILTDLKKAKSIGLILPDSFLLNTNSIGYRSKIVNSYSVSIKGYTNTFRAFDADVRKKFVSIVCRPKTSTKSITGRFGLKAGRSSCSEERSTEIKLNNSDISKFSKRFIIPDLRSKAELEILKDLSSAREQLSHRFELNGKQIHAISRLNKLIRGRDISFARSDNKVNESVGNSYSLIWRKVSKDDNTRTLLVGIINDNECTESNSVHRISGLNVEDALKLYCVLNCILADFFIKTQMTVNITKEMLADMPIPEWENINLIRAAYLTGKGVFGFSDRFLRRSFGHTNFSTKQLKALSSPISTIGASDLLVCKAFGLSMTAISVILDRRFKTFTNKFPEYLNTFKREDGTNVNPSESVVAV